MKRERLSSKFIQSLKHPRAQSGAIVLMLVSLLVSSCNNIRKSLNDVNTSSTNLASPSTGNGSSFQITGVYASQQAPASRFDVLTTDSLYDTFCSGTYSPCVCEMSYDSPGIGPVTVQGAVVYQESNLIGCLNTVQGGISQFDLKVKTATGSVSNTLTVTLSSGGFLNTTYVDLSKEDAYVDVKRFQCRKREFIPNPMSTNIVDPFQSEDPKLIYPFNYYTTNVSDSLWAIQTAPNQDWECTINPNSNNSLQWWANPVVFSKSTCSGIGNTFCGADYEHIYRYDTLEIGNAEFTSAGTTYNALKGRARSSFRVSKTQYGVFDVPLRAAIGPSQNTGASAYETSSVGVIGFAARSIPNISGTSSCPSIDIPSNARWVKLWHFRSTNLTAPSYAISSPAMTASGIMCNSTEDKNVFPSCYLPGVDQAAPPGQNPITMNTWKGVRLIGNPSSNSYLTTNTVESPDSSNNYFIPAGGSIYPADNSNTILSRVAMLTGSNGNSSGSLTHACYNISKMNQGKELWHPSPFAGTFTADAMKNLPWNIYKHQNLFLTNQVCGTFSSYYLTVGSSGACTAVNSNLPDLTNFTMTEPHDILGSNDLTKFTNNNYIDHLFVVTDPSVNDNSMINSTQSEYIPVTYRTKADCNPAAQTSTQTSLGCNPSGKVDWGVSVQDVDVNSGPIVYPLCVLQFKD